MKQNQHYVPKFYLKNFSLNDKAINLYNLKNDSFCVGSIKEQCSKQHFYSKDPELEKYFSKGENDASQIIGKILSNDVINIKPENMEDMLMLYVFISWQYTRTKKMADDIFMQMNIMFDSVKQAAMKSLRGEDREKMEERLANVNMSKDNLALELSRKAMANSPILSSLEVLLVVNKSKVEIITSDAPVVFFNSYFNNKEVYRQTAFTNKGLQIFYPLSPKHMIILFDPKYYTIPNKLDRVVYVYSKKDIRRLNGLQIIFCQDNIFYSTYNKSDLRLQQKELLKHRTEEKDFITESVGISIADRKRKEIVRYYKRAPHYDLKKLLFMKTCPSASIDPTPGARNPMPIDIFIDYFEWQLQKKDGGM